MSLICFVTLFGCNDSQSSDPKQPRVGVNKGQRRALPNAQWASPSEDECYAFCSQIEEAVLEGDADAIRSAIDWDTLINRGISGVPASEEARRSFKTGIKQSIRRDNRLASEIIRNVGTDGSYRLVRLRESKGRQEAVFRLQSETGINYHVMPLVKKPNGQVQAVDIYMYLAGEYFSETLGRGFLSLSKESSKTWLEKLTSEQNDFVAHLDDYGEMGNCYREGRHEEVIAIYGRLPRSLKKHKSFLLARLVSAAQLEESLYQTAIDDFRKYHPRDPSLELIAIDGYFLKKDFEKAIECVDRLDESVGGDPYLDVYRANMLLEQGKTDDAIRAAERAVENEPMISECYWTLLNVFLLSNKHARTAATLDLLEERFEIVFDDLTEVPEYAQFVASPEGKRWLEQRQQSQDESPETSDEVPAAD